MGENLIFYIKFSLYPIKEQGEVSHTNLPSSLRLHGKILMEERERAKWCLR